MENPAGLLRRLWRAGVASVSGERAVATALARDGVFPASLVVSVGKAACSMFLGAAACISPRTRSIIVTKDRHVDPACRRFAGTEILEAGHPVPDERSLAAGDTILQAIAGAKERDRLLLLVSGGASALAEVLRPGHDLDELHAVTRRLLGGGQSIAEINGVRSRMSRLKGGGLLGEFRGRDARMYALSDVRGDELAVIGAGIGDPCRATVKVQASVVASNAVARSAVAAEAETLGCPVRLDEESLYQDVFPLAATIANRLIRGPSGIYIWGGEPTIELPRHPGEGGRNQSLALAIAGHIRGVRGIAVLAAGTDGTDGPTDYAGAYVDGSTVDDPRQAAAALRRADAGPFLRARGCLFESGPSNTNVMDLVLAVVT